jgi:hypothetical protein
MLVEVGKEVFVGSVFEVFTTDFNGDDFLIGEGRQKAAAPDIRARSQSPIFCDYQTVDHDDKSIAIHRACPSVV